MPTSKKQLSPDSEQTSVVQTDKPDMHTNPNVLAMALELFQRSYPRSKPSDNPTLWEVHVDHIIKVLDSPIMPEGRPQDPTPQPLKDAAAEAEAILFGGGSMAVLAKLAAKQKMELAESVKEDASQSVGKAAEESEDAKLAFLNSGSIKAGSGTFTQPVE